MTNLAKSKKLQREEAAKPESSFLTAPDLPVAPIEVGPIKIKEVPCCNEFVAILQFNRIVGIEVTEDYKYKDEGIVIGAGPGVPAANGVRPGSQFKLGDVVAFQGRSIVSAIESATPPYAGKRIIIVSERNIMLKLPPVQFEIIE